MENEKIKDRIEELKKEIKAHQEKVAMAQQVMNNETAQAISKNGAIIELEKIIKETKE
jgi:guanylate kinase